MTKWCVLGGNVIGAMGWSGVRFEDQYRATQNGAGAFVASSMSYLRISGSDAGAVLDAVSPRPVSDLAVGGARFVVFTTPSGTVDDEAIVLRTAPTEFELSMGGGKEPSWLALVAARFPDVVVLPSDLVSFNIKGPRRLAAVVSLVHAADAAAVSGLRPFRSCVVRPLVGDQARVVRTVIGYEVWARPETLSSIWHQMLTERPQIVPCGWDLLTVYRLECEPIVFGLYPVDLHSGTTLWEVGCGWMVADDNGRDYVGREALREARGRDQLWLAGLASLDDSPPPLIGREVFSADGDFVGYVTSAGHSPRHGRSLAFSHLVPGCTAGQEVVVEQSRWVVRSLPFGDPASANVRQLSAVNLVPEP